jgi:hypothetical protein
MGSLCFLHVSVKLHCRRREPGFIAVKNFTSPSPLSNQRESSYAVLLIFVSYFCAKTKRERYLAQSLYLRLLY